MDHFEPQNSASSDLWIRYKKLIKILVNGGGQ